MSCSIAVLIIACTWCVSYIYATCIAFFAELFWEKVQTIFIGNYFDSASLRRKQFIRKLIDIENYISISMNINPQLRLRLLISRVVIRHAIASQQINRAHVKAHTFCCKEEKKKRQREGEKEVERATRSVFCNCPGKIVSSFFFPFGLSRLSWKIELCCSDRSKSTVVYTYICMCVCVCVHVVLVLLGCLTRSMKFRWRNCRAN